MRRTLAALIVTEDAKVGSACDNTRPGAARLDLLVRRGGIPNGTV